MRRAEKPRKHCAIRQNVALEIAQHEEQERKAWEGELWVLARAWEQAEEITAI
jgi:hypothetical protein